MPQNERRVVASGSPVFVTQKGAIGEAVEVAILDPEEMFSIADPKATAQLAALPGEAKKRLQAVLEVLAPV